MKTFILVVLIFISSCVPVFAEEVPDDGFYLRGEGGASPKVKSPDGHELFLGQRQTLKVDLPRLASRNNENTRFVMSVTIPFDPDLGSTMYILMVDGKAYGQSGSGSSGNIGSSIDFYFSGKENAEQISRFIKTPVIYREHPQHNLLVSFSPSKQVFVVGEEVTATLRITNVGTKTVAFMQGGRNRGQRDNQYIFSARYAIFFPRHRDIQVEDVGSSIHTGGLAFTRILKPGDVFTDKINLNKWFAFDKSVMYEVHGSYYLNFMEPGGDIFQTIWEDYVSADFVVKMTKPIQEDEKLPEAKNDVKP